MVDIHSHILPFIDDGASDLKDSIKMLENTIESGVDTIVATPHLYPGNFMAPTAHRDEMLTKVKEEVERRQMSIEIIPGRECFLSPELYDYEKDIGKLTVNENGRYLLIEFSMQEIPPYAHQMIFDMQMREVTPIIAHMERYYHVILDPNLTHKYIDMGCLIQVNIGSIFGKYGNHVQQTAKTLLEHQMVHIVASDMHSPKSMPLGTGIERLAEIVGQEEAQCLVEERPRAVIENRSVPRPDPQVYRPKKSFRNLWGLLRKPSPSDRGG